MLANHNIDIATFSIVTSQQMPSLQPTPPVCSAHWRYAWRDASACGGAGLFKICATHAGRHLCGSPLLVDVRLQQRDTLTTAQNVPAAAPSVSSPSAVGGRACATPPVLTMPHACRAFFAAHCAIVAAAVYRIPYTPPHTHLWVQLHHAHDHACCAAAVASPHRLPSLCPLCALRRFCAPSALVQAAAKPEASHVGSASSEEYSGFALTLHETVDRSLLDRELRLKSVSSASVSTHACGSSRVLALRTNCRCACA